ncbi:MAG: cytosine permease, partial [Solirubrobacterales bacterium]|nr:cytosine permease [Solirubrobacterales bacterium]
MAQTEAPEAAAIEQRTISQVPLSERHGRVRDLFTIWFGSNVMLLTIVTGALATTVYGLSLAWAGAAIIVGNLLGAVFMALHSVQGPRLGVPQMIQSRGQFGAWGAIVVVAVVMIMYLGFIASNAVLGGESIN